MKKILSILLVLIMTVSVIGLVSCKDDNTLTCGVTIFENMNELDENGEWTGFETEFAQAVGEIIGMDVEFQEIEWSQKYTELASGNIDCIWNGFTANSKDDDGKARSEKVDFSYGYMLNQQCVVINKADADLYKTEADLAGKTAGVEGGSAGESYAASVIGEDGELLEYAAQNNAFMELAADKIDFAVVDILLAKSKCGQGDFEDLMIVEDIELSSEIYAVGFEKGSELTAKVNDAIEQLFEDGTVQKLAEKYGFENVIQLTKEIK